MLNKCTLSSQVARRCKRGAHSFEDAKGQCNAKPAYSQPSNAEDPQVYFSIVKDRRQRIAA